MKDPLAHFVARFPGQERIIKALSESSARFQDLLRDHHDVHSRLSKVSDDPAQRPELEARYRNIEEELIRLIQGYPMA